MPLSCWAGHRTPDQAARLRLAVITSALKRARRRHVEDRAHQLRKILKTPELRQPPVLQSAYAAVVASEVAIIGALNVQIDRLGAVVGNILGTPRVSVGQGTAFWGRSCCG